MAAKTIDRHSYILALGAFIVCIVLWKGGKSVDSTWLFGGMAVLATAVTCLLDRDLRKMSLPSWFHILWVSFLGVSVLSYAYSSTQNYGLDEIIRDVSAYLLCGAVWKFARLEPKRALPGLASALTIATLLACAVGALVYSLQPVNRFVGSFFDSRFITDYWPNAWAQYLLLAWPVVLYRMREWKWWNQGLLLGVLLAALCLSYSRGGFLAASAQIVLLLSLTLWDRSARKELSGFILTAGLAVIVAFGLFTASNAVRQVSFPVQSVVEKATFTAAEGTSSISERQQFWVQSVMLAADRPWLGWGPYSFRFVQPRLQTAVYETSDHPHNVFLKIAMERGTPACIIFLSLLAAFFITTCRAAKANTSAGRFAVFACLGVIGVLIHSFIDYNLQFVSIAAPFWILLAAASAQNKQVVPARGNTLELSVSVLLLILLVWEGFFLVTSSLGRRAEAANNLVQADYYYQLSSPELFSRDLALAHGALLLRMGEPERALPVIDRAIRQNPEDARVWQLQGDAAREQQDWELAVINYYKAYNLAPYNYLSPFVGFLGLTVADREHRGYYRQPMVQEELFRIMRSYSLAIQKNSHFIALSDSVELLGRASTLLSKAYPSQSAYLQSLTTPAIKHAKTERERLATAPRGMLW